MRHHPRSDNAFEQDKPGTDARDQVEARIEKVRQQGGVFVEAVRATRMAMVLTDPALPGNPIVFANQSFLDLTGYSLDQVLGQQPHFMNGTGTDPNDAERFRSILENDQDGVVETVQYAKDGRRFVATVLLSAFKDDAGHTTHHFLSWADITRQVDAEADADDLRKAQEALHASEERKSFLLRLGDAMRAQPDANAVMEVAARMLGERLNASRIMFAEYDHVNRLANIFHGWFADGAMPFPAVLRLDDFKGDILDDLGAGRTVRIDNAGPPFERPDLAAIATLGVKALLSPPLIVNGTLVMNVSAHQHEPRHWTDNEVTLVQEVSERLWAELARARTEAALRESEKRYRELFERIDEGFCIIEVIFDDGGKAIDYLFVEVNPAFERHTGIPDAAGRRMRDIVPEHEEHWFRAYGEVALSGQAKRLQALPSSWETASTI